jgi:hypothetical protein
MPKPEAPHEYRTDRFNPAHGGSSYIEAVKGPAQGKVQLFQNENPVAAPVDLYAAEPARSGRLLLGRLSLAEGKNSLMLKIVGRNEQSAGLGLDLVSLICVRQDRER